MYIMRGRACQCSCSASHSFTLSLSHSLSLSVSLTLSCRAAATPEEAAKVVINFAKHKDIDLTPEIVQGIACELSCLRAVLARVHACSRVHDLLRRFCAKRHQNHTKDSSISSSPALASLLHPKPCTPKPLCVCCLENIETNTRADSAQELAPSFLAGDGTWGKMTSDRWQVSFPPSLCHRAPLYPSLFPCSLPISLAISRHVMS